MPRRVLANRLAAKSHLQGTQGSPRREVQNLLSNPQTFERRSTKVRTPRHQEGWQWRTEAEQSAEIPRCIKTPFNVFKANPTTPRNRKISTEQTKKHAEPVGREIPLNFKNKLSKRGPWILAQLKKKITSNSPSNLAFAVHNRFSVWQSQWSIEN
jgi:hypothetical protein